MGNCKCSVTDIDNDNQIRADKTVQNLQGHEITFVDSKADIGFNKQQKNQNIKSSKGSRHFKQGVIVQRMQQALANENVQILDQQMNESQKLIAKNSLRKHCIFSQLQQYELEIIVKKIILCKSKAGQYIFQEGNLAGSYYIIFQGQCSLQISGHFKKSLKVGSTFGDLAILYNCVRTGSIKSKLDCVLGMISQQIFRNVIEELTQSEVASNLKLLEQVQVFKNFAIEYKQAIAAHCLTQVYDEGYVVVNQGDRANSLYIIKQGTLIILQKNIELGPKQCIGQSCVIGGGIRSNTIFCKTKSQLVSISSQSINKILQQNAKRKLILNLVLKIIRDSKIIGYKSDKEIEKLVEKCQIQKYEPGKIVIRKHQINADIIYINVGSILKGQEAQIKSNTVVKLQEFMLQNYVIFECDYIASKNGFLAKIPLVEFNRSERFRKLTEKFLIQQQKSTKQEKLMQLNQLTFLRVLTKGNFGTIILTYFKGNQKFYAVKALEIQKIKNQNLQIYIENQLAILRDVRKHPLIINFHKFVKGCDNYYFIMDYVFGQDMYQFLNRVSSINQSDTLFYLSQLVVALEHLHIQKIIYRDLKPQNIMLNQDGYIVLIDFGAAKILSLQQRYKTKTIIGTPHYMAPQIIIGKGYSFSVDIWSLGIVTYEMMFGRLPYGDQQNDPFSIYEDIMNKKQIYFPKKSSDSIQDLIRKLLNKKPQKRIGFRQIKSHQCLETIEWQKIIDKSITPPHKPEYQNYLDINKQSLSKINQIPKQFKQMSNNFIGTYSINL